MRLSWPPREDQSRGFQCPTIAWGTGHGLPPRRDVTPHMVPGDDTSRAATGGRRRRGSLLVSMRRGSGQASARGDSGESERAIRSDRHAHQPSPRLAGSTGDQPEAARRGSDQANWASVGERPSPGTSRHADTVGGAGPLHLATVSNDSLPASATTSTNRAVTDRILRAGLSTCPGSSRQQLYGGAVVTYLIVGLDRKTHVAWHENVSAGDTGTAKRIAQARAKAKGIDLVVAAVIGPNSAVVLAPAEGRTLSQRPPSPRQPHTPPWARPKLPLFSEKLSGRVLRLCGA